MGRARAVYYWKQSGGLQVVDMLYVQREGAREGGSERGRKGEREREGGRGREGERETKKEGGRGRDD
jgi:hypothetical protein